MGTTRLGLPLYGEDPHKRSLLQQYTDRAVANLTTDGPLAKTSCVLPPDFTDKMVDSALALAASSMPRGSVVSVAGYAIHLEAHLPDSAPASSVIHMAMEPLVREYDACQHNGDIKRIENLKLNAKLLGFEIRDGAALTTWLPTKTDD